MDERSMRIVFSSGISDITERNSSFDSGVLRVCYTGRNRNNSFISKETFERCMPSIYNCPIVCRYDRETDTIGSHDMELVADTDGGMHIVNATHPVGIIPESAKFWWENIEDDSGIHEYLCVDALLWKRQEAYRKIKEDGITDESMEISVKEGEMVDGVYVINRFEFTAFCLLGTAQPCYESASLELFSCEDFKVQLAEMMQDFKKSYTTVQSSDEVVIHKQKILEGGNEGLEQKIALMNEYGLTADMLDFNIDDYSEEELRNKFEALKTAAQNTNASAAGSSAQRFDLEGGLRQELSAAVEAAKIETRWGLENNYWFWDYDRDANEVYATDTTDWNIYGFPYSMDGDRVVVDFTHKRRMKISLSPFNEGEQNEPLDKTFSRVMEKCEANDSAWREKYQTASETISSMETELETLRQFKTDTENTIAKNERNKIFSRFEDLTGIDAFETLRENCAEYSINDLEEKCYAIRGRNGSGAKFSYEPKAPKLPIEKNVAASEPYGGVFAEYGITSSKQNN